MAILLGGVSLTRALRPDTLLFALLHATVGIFLLLHGLDYAGLLLIWPHLAWLSLPFQYAAAPLFYILFRARVAGDRFEFSGRQVIHLVAPILATVVLLPVYFQSAAIKRLILEGVAGNSFVLSIVQLGVTPVFLFYLMLILIPLRNLWSARPRSDIGIAAGVLAADGILVIVLGAIGQLYDVFYLRLSSATLSFAVALSFFVRHWRPYFMEHLGEQATIARYQHSRLGGVDLDNTAQRIRNLMVTDRMFLREELGLPELARAANLSPHQLSEYLNQRLEKNFYTFLNEYRVEEACRQLVENPERTVLEVAFASGFNSRTSFNVAFAKITGVTPVQYRRRFARPLHAKT